MQRCVNLGIRGEDLLLGDQSQSYQTLKDTRKHGGNVTWLPVTEKDWEIMWLNMSGDNSRMGRNHRETNRARTQHTMNWTVWVHTGSKAHQSQENQWVIRWKGKQISHRLVIGECVQISKLDCKHYLVGVSQHKITFSTYFTYTSLMWCFSDWNRIFNKQKVKQFILFGDVTQKEWHSSEILWKYNDILFLWMCIKEGTEWILISCWR